MPLPPGVYYRSYVDSRRVPSKTVGMLVEQILKTIRFGAFESSAEEFANICENICSRYEEVRYLSDKQISLLLKFVGAIHPAKWKKDVLDEIRNHDIPIAWENQLKDSLK